MAILERASVEWRESYRFGVSGEDATPEVSFSAGSAGDDESRQRHLAGTMPRLGPAALGTQARPSTGGTGGDTGPPAWGRIG